MADLNNNGRSTSLGLGKPFTVEQGDMYTQGLPKALRDYLKFDSPIDWCPRSIYKYYRKLGTEETLRILRFTAAKDTSLIYDANHPQARRA